MQNGSIDLATDKPPAEPDTTNSDVTNNSEPEVQEDHGDPPERDILYGLNVKVDDKSKSFYRDSPFGGVDLKLLLDSDGRGSEDKNTVVLKICADVGSSSLKDREGNSENDWWYNRAEFDFGKQLRLESTDGRRIQIVSKRLVAALDAIIDYKPEILDLSQHDYNPATDCYQSFMLFYDDLKRLYLSHAEVYDKPDDHVLHSTIKEQVSVYRDLHIDQFWEDFGRTESHHPWDHQLHREVAILLRLISPHYHSKVSSVVHDLQLEQPRIHFDKLWLLYKPGTIVYRRRNDRLQGLVVCKAQRCTDNGESDSEGLYGLVRYEIEAWYYEYDGKILCRVRTTERVIQYEGYRSVLMLPFVPAKIYDQANGIADRERLMKRSRKLLQITRECFSHKLFEHPRSAYQGEIVIDPAEYNARMTPLCQAGDWTSVLYEDERRAFEFESGETIEEAIEIVRKPEPRDGRGYKRLIDYHELNPSKAEDMERLSTTGLLVLAEFVGGMALATKKWMRFDVDGISNEPPPQQGNQLRDRLVIAEEDREILQTVLVRTATKNEVQADFVTGKGEGQVLLLHGPPGTGKTMTAECLANDAQRPLVSLTQSDLTSKFGSISETALRQWFLLAAKWRAILLIDEADTFLGKRKDNEHGNSLVTGKEAPCLATYTQC